MLDFIKSIKKNAVDYEINIHFHDSKQKSHYSSKTDAKQHTHTHLVLGWHHVSFESQSEVVCGLHQVLRGTDQNLINWTCNRPRCLHQRTALLGTDKDIE